MGATLNVRTFYRSGWQQIGAGYLFTVMPVITVTTTGTTFCSNSKLVVTYKGVTTDGRTSFSGSNTSYVTVGTNKTAQIYANTEGSNAYSDNFGGTLTISVSLDTSTGTITASKTYAYQSVFDNTNFAKTGGVDYSYNNSEHKFYFGSPITFETTDGTYSDYTFSVFVCIGDEQITVLDKVEGGLSYNWTPSVSEYAPSITGRDSIGIQLNYEMYNVDGSMIMSYTLMTSSIYLPESVVPKHGTVTLYDTKSYYNTYGVFVAQQSNISATVSGTGIYGSLIRKIDYSYDNKQGNVVLETAESPTTVTIPLGTPMNTGSQTLKTTVTDTRNRQATKSTTVQVSAYTSPTVTIQANRWDTIENEGSDGSDTVRIDIGGNIPSINSHLVEGTLVIRGRQKDAAQWTVISTISVSGTIEETVYAYSQSIDSNWEYHATLTDSFGTAVEGESSVGTATPILEFHSSGKGMGIGTVAPEVGLDVGMQANFKGTAEDGYSRIQITDPEGNDSVILANLAGSELQLLLNALGSYDHAKIGSHIFMQNNKALGAMTTSGGQTSILRMNTSNQVELTWTSGGMRGRVWKTLWSGTLSAGGTVTISELPYYNVFAFRSSDSVGVGVRYSGSIRIHVIMSSLSGNATNEFNQIMFRLYASGTTLGCDYSLLVDPVTNAYMTSNNTVNEVIGIL